MERVPSPSWRPEVADLVRRFDREGEIVVRSSRTWILIRCALIVPCIVLTVVGGFLDPSIGVALLLVFGLVSLVGVVWILRLAWPRTRARVDHGGVHYRRRTVPWSQIREATTGVVSGRGGVLSSTYTCLVLVGDGLHAGPELRMAPFLDPDGATLSATLNILLPELRTAGGPPSRPTVWPAEPGGRTGS